MRRLIPLKCHGDKAKPVTLHKLMMTWLRDDIYIDNWRQRECYSILWLTFMDPNIDGWNTKLNTTKFVVPLVCYFRFTCIWKKATCTIHAPAMPREWVIWWESGDWKKGSWVSSIFQDLMYLHSNVTTLRYQDSGCRFVSVHLLSNKFIRVPQQQEHSRYQHVPGVWFFRS